MHTVIHFYHTPSFIAVQQSALFADPMGDQEVTRILVAITAKATRQQAIFFAEAPATSTGLKPYADILSSRACYSPRS